MSLGASFVRKTIAILVLSMLVFGLLSFVSPYSVLHTSLPGIRSANAVTTTSLVFDCAYGSSTDGAVFPASITTSAPYSAADYDGTPNTSCQATDLADTDGALHPLVSDNPTAVANPGAGGGLTIDIVAVLNSTTTMGGFDVSVRYDPHVLNAVLIDQSGLIWGGTGLTTGQFVLTLAKSIDPTAGTVRLAQVLVSAPQQGGNSELFRVRFDVVGASLGTPITFFNDVLVNPSVIVHNDVNLNGPGVDTTSIYNFLNGGTALNLVSNWTFAPKPGVPGSLLTFTSQAYCPGCSGALTYSWDFSSSDSPTYIAKSQATTNPAAVTPPPPVVNRVTLTINDSATPAPHFMRVTRLLPLVSKASPSLTTLATNTAGGAWSGEWLGGVTTTTAGYGGGWTFCPGTALVKTVCSNPVQSISQTGAGITQTSSAPAITYKFAGLYDAAFKVTDAPETQIGTSPTGNVALFSFLNNVTGSPAAFTVSVTAPSTSLLIGANSNITATIAYDPNYPGTFQATSFNYIFDFGDGNRTAILGSGAISLLHTYTSAGSFAIKVTAQEHTSARAVTLLENGFLSVNVAAILCKITGSCDFTIGTSSIVSGGSVAFTAVATGGITPYYFTWNFGDGSSATGQTVNHTYQSGGKYNVTLIITDSGGQTRQVKKTITVASAPSLPISPAILAGIAAAIIIALAAVLLYYRRRKVSAKPSPSLGGAR